MPKETRTLKTRSACYTVPVPIRHALRLAFTGRLPVYVHVHGGRVHTEVLLSLEPPADSVLARMPRTSLVRLGLRIARRMAAHAWRRLRVKSAPGLAVLRWRR
jgi:hypothetical protein